MDSYDTNPTKGALWEVEALLCAAVAGVLACLHGRRCRLPISSAALPLCLTASPTPPISSHPHHPSALTRNTHQLSPATPVSPHRTTAFPALTPPHPAGLLINFDCSCMWFREGRAAWAREALSLTPEYLRHHANELDYKASTWMGQILTSQTSTRLICTLFESTAAPVCLPRPDLALHRPPPRPAPQDLQVPLGRKFRWAAAPHGSTHECRSLRSLAWQLRATCSACPPLQRHC